MKLCSPIKVFLNSPFLAVFALILLSCSALSYSAVDIEFTPEEQAFIANTPNVIVGVESDWPPIDYIHKGQHSGLASDYLKLVEERTGLHFNIVSGFTWDNLLKMLFEKRLDLLPAIYWSEERDKKLHYTSPYLQLRHYAFVKSSARASITNMNDLFGKTIVVPKGYAYLEQLEKDYPRINILMVNTTIEAIDAVITGQADTLIENTALINYFLKEHNIHGLEPSFAVEFGINKLYMATNIEGALLASIIDKALKSVTSEEARKISEKWLSSDANPLPSASAFPITLFNIEEQRYLQKKKKIKTCIDPNWLPYEGFIKNKHSGITSEYLAYFAEQIGVPIEVVHTTSWEESLQFVRLRRCDMLTLASNRPERRKYLTFTKPYIRTSLALATQSNEVFYTHFNELEGKRVGIIKGYSPSQVIHKRYPNIELVEFINIKAGLEQVRAGTILGFLDAVPTLSYHIQNDFPGDLKISGKFDYDWSSGVAVRNDEPILATILDKVIQSIPESVHNRIRTNWLGVRYEQAVDYTIVWQLLTGFSFILILVILRYRQLSRHRNEIALKNSELALINEQLEAQKESAQHLANHDLLTGLPNRSQLLSRLEHAIDLASRQKNQVAVFFIDLDRFKYINDSLGHHFGDDLLRQVGAQMRMRLRSTDTLARIGGDEFIVVLESFEDEESPAKIAQELIETIQQPFTVMGHVLNVSASLGISIYPDDSEDIHTLIKHADIAMYRAKELGRNRFRYYTQFLSELTEKRLKTDAALREALSLNQFSLFFQPIIDLQTCRVSHAEALIRWNHPDMGMISPEYFIPIAEENGLIHELGLWVFREACRCFKDWKKEGLYLNAVSVNVSSIQFQKGDLAETFKSILKEENIKADCIDIEITERYLMDQTERNIHYLNTLKEAGHTISVDDFGVGYSSMSYMKRLPLNTIKIDRSFISDIPEDRNDIQISQAIIALSHNLGYKSTAEGVEKHEQFSFLRETGCNHAQGYYFSRPVPKHEFISCVERLNKRLNNEADASHTIYI